MEKEKIQRYLNRIRVELQQEANLDFLRVLQRNHLLHVPFENLDIHSHIPIVLDIHAFYRKVVEKGRGGFCYELNGLFNELLQALGFQAILASARVFKGPEQYSDEFDHACILVFLGSDTWLVDVGFGEFSLSPILLDVGRSTEDSDGTYKIEKWDSEYFLVSSKTGDVDWKREYLFSLRSRSLVDFVPRCIYHQTSRESHFTQKRVCSLATEKGRITLTDSVLKIREGNETTVEEISDAPSFNVKLYQYFGIKG